MHRLIFTLSSILCLALPAHAAAEADLLIAYDNSFSDGVGGDENAEVLTANAVGASNWINEQSGTPARMRICGYHKTFGQAGRTSLGGFAGWMWNYGDGNLDDVTAAADALGADLVAYICQPAPGEGAAAVAYQPGRYAVYGPANFWNNVVAHESGGHNYGCDHRDGRQDPKTIMMHNYCGGGSQPFFSNPNIWLNGARLLGEGSCLGGTAHAGGDNAYLISIAAQGVADSHPRRVWGSNLSPIVHRWQFNKPAGAVPAGTTVASDVGGAAATVRGQGATFTGTGLRLPGGTTGNTATDSIAAYIDLPNGLFSSMTNFTIEIWATPLSAKNWMRIIEIGRTAQAGDGLGAAGEYTGEPGNPAPGGTQASDVIGLSACTWTGSLNNQRFLAGVDGIHQTADSNLATTAGQMHHYAITFRDTASGGTVKWFRDGALIHKLDVGFKSAELEDVNNWLGRSMWSGDEMAHIEYHDIRIQSIALADGQVAGNHRIGPHDSVSTLWANDEWGSSGFISGAWEFGGIPVPGRQYETGTMMLRTPRNQSNVSFPGGSLTITGGDLHLNATGPRTTTINDLRLNGGTVGSFGDGNSTQTLAGNITVMNGTFNHIRGGWGPMVISSTISGVTEPNAWGAMLYTENAVTLTGNNSNYRGATIIGDGRFSKLRVSHETNLGGNPGYYGGAWLELNRGILETTATMTIDDPNRGVRIGPSGGFLRPAAGTTLTIDTPVTSPAAGNTLHTSPLDSNPIAGMLFKDGPGTLTLTSPNNSHNGEMQILQGELRIGGSGRLNNGDHWMPITLNSTLNYDSTATQTLRGRLSGTGTLVKNNTGTLNLNGSNPFTGTLTVNGGTLHANPGNAPNNRALSFASGITVNNGGTLRAGANGLFGWDGTQERAIIVNTGGTLTADANADVGLGTVTLAGGTLANLGPSTAWGSWRFNNPTDKLLVTQDSTVSATNVKFGDPAAAIEVQSARTLTITGTITNATSGGTSHLRKTGAGTLVLAGTNTYTGTTSLETGTTRVNGSLANTTITVANGAILSGTGSIGGPLTFTDGSIHAPGNPTGTQSANGLNYEDGARIRWNLPTNDNAIGSAGHIAAGNVSITAGARIDLVFNTPGSNVDFTNPFWSQSRSWTIMTASSISGAFSLGDITPDAAGITASMAGQFSLVQAPASVTVVFSPNAITLSPAQAWRQHHFETIENTGDAADDADPDRDGIINLLERAFGGDPKHPDPSILPAVDPDEPLLTIVYTRSKNIPDLILTVQSSPDLSPGSWVPAGGTETTTDLGESERVLHTVAPGTSGRMFLRVHVTEAP